MDQTDQIREKLDIVGLISEYIPVKKAGRNFKANCPFHQENTPSFFISPEKQMWHCFGCSKGGDCFTFLMEYERLEFPEALRILAKRTGVELTQSRAQTGILSKKESIYTLNKQALEFYHYLLTSHNAGKKAREYLAQRGVNEKLQKTFKIGFAPSMKTALSDYLIKKKRYKGEELVDAGLAFFRGRETQDFFINRIMFPIIDHRDNIIGFSGRILTDNERGPKYINTRETLVYHKGETLYGLSFAKEAMRKSDQVVLVEGEFDMIACFQEGITNVVATKGTAFTLSQAQLLARFVKRVTICFDGDKAGQEAIKRSLPALEKAHLNVSVVTIPEGKDPADAILKNSAGFKQALKNEIPVYDFLLTKTNETYNVNTAEGKERITAELLPLFIDIENEIVKEHYLKKLSTALDTTYESMQKEIEKQQKKQASEKHVIVSAKKRPREEVLEEYLASLLVQAPSTSRAAHLAASILSDVLGTERAYQKLLSQLASYVATSEHFDTKAFGTTLPEELHDAFNTSSLYPIPPLNDEEKYLKEVEKIAKELKLFTIRQRMKTVAGEIRQKEKAGEEVDSLRSDYSRLASMLET